MFASVIIVSQGRRDSLLLTLQSLRFQTHGPFELIVVGDEAAGDAVQASGDAARIVFVAFAAPNIALARNAGLAQAQGDIVAFIDDDAVAEPRWLEGLVQGFADPRVAVAGGFVRGPNGISFQWRGETVDRLARHAPLSLPEDRISLLGWNNDRAPEVMGTNCAYRTELLRLNGGFDPGFAYLLDESDVNLRLSQAGYLTAIVPWAEVHHKLAPSPRRTADKVPRDLGQAGRSTALFVAKHARPDEKDMAFAAARQDQHRKLVRLMIAGHLLPGAVVGLMRGFQTGLETPIQPPRHRASLTPERSTRRLFEVAPRALDALTLSSGLRGAGQAAQRAREAAAEGRIVTLFLLSPTALFHRISFHPDGYWLHQGGLYGKSDRAGPLVQFWRRKQRIAAEQAIRARARPF